nr:AraC family transcriptional regulator [Clostridium sp. D33t1_170424_F3]
MVFDLTERVAQAQTQKAYSFPISQCIQYIDNHLHQELSLQTLADELQLSTRYLSRLFKQETGVNLTAYIQQERIREAQNLLLFSEKSLSEISNFLCFVSQSYFIQIFKRYTGMTPQQFRRSNRRKSACTRNSS